MYKTIFMVFVTCVLSTLGQLCLKKTVNTMGRLGMHDIQHLGTLMVKLFSFPLMWAGLVFYIAGSILWLVVLSRVNLSYAYPLISMNFILIILASWLFLGETLSYQRIIAVSLICCGIFVLK